MCVLSYPTAGQEHSSPMLGESFPNFFQFETYDAHPSYPHLTQEDIRGAIMIFTGRLRTWLKAHPVQGHLCQGLVSLERLAT
jgi:hypothetical protein